MASLLALFLLTQTLTVLVFRFDFFSKSDLFWLCLSHCSVSKDRVALLSYHTLKRLVKHFFSCPSDNSQLRFPLSQSAWLSYHTLNYSVKYFFSWFFDNLFWLRSRSQPDYLTTLFSPLSSTFFPSPSDNLALPFLRAPLYYLFSPLLSTTFFPFLLKNFSLTISIC